MQFGCIADGAPHRVADTNFPGVPHRIATLRALNAYTNPAGAHPYAHIGQQPYGDYRALPMLQATAAGTASIAFNTAIDVAAPGTTEGDTFVPVASMGFGSIRPGMACAGDGITAACFYTATYAAMNVGAFTVITQIAGYDESTRSIDDYTGLTQRRPVLAALLAFFLLSMIGIPFTGGFFGKFLVFTAAVHAGHVWLAVIGLLNSGVACFYYLRLLSALYTRPAPSDAPYDRPRLSGPINVALAATALATLLLGVLPWTIVRTAGRAAFDLYAAQQTPVPAAVRAPELSSR